MADLPFPDAGKPNWANQTIWTGDNLDIMRGMNSESVDLIYLDVSVPRSRGAGLFPGDPGRWID